MPDGRTTLFLRRLFPDRSPGGRPTPGGVMGGSACRPVGIFHQFPSSEDSRCPERGSRPLYGAEEQGVQPPHLRAGIIYNYEYFPPEEGSLVRAVSSRPHHAPSAGSSHPIGSGTRRTANGHARRKAVREPFFSQQEGSRPKMQREEWSREARRRHKR